MTANPPSDARSVSIARVVASQDGRTLSAASRSVRQAAYSATVAEQLGCKTERSQRTLPTAAASEPGAPASVPTEDARQALSCDAHER
jgi:hypothetical protein